MKRCIVWVGICCFAIVVGGSQIADRGRCDVPKPDSWPRIDQTQYVGSKKCGRVSPIVLR